MEFRTHKPSDLPVTENLFVSVFSESENEEEGNLIGSLVKELVISSDSRDLYGFVAIDEGQMVGAIFFSRLIFEKHIDVFILAPVAVATDHQGLGIGQALIKYGLQEMKKTGVRIAITYGDPAYYSKVGFQRLSQDLIKAPLRLSQPEGWLGLSLTDEPIGKIPGSCTCVKALDNPAYW